MSSLTAYELKILQDIAGQKDPCHWGSGVGQALEMLASSGYITKKFGGEVTEKGRQALACVLAGHTAPSMVPDGLVQFLYTNYRGEVGIRSVLPKGISHLQNPGYGYEPGWFLIGFDVGKQADRIFSLSNIQTASQELHLRW